MTTTAEIIPTQKPKSEAEIVNALSVMDKAEIRKFRKSVPKVDLSNIPGDNGMPFLGHMYWFIRDIRHWAERQYNKYGPVFKFKTPLVESVFLLGPEANRLLLQNESKIFSNYLSWGPTFTGIFDNAVLARDFNYHKKTRKLLQLAFKRPAIEDHMQLMNPALKDGISKWPNDRPINTLESVKKLLLDTGAKVFLGIDIGPEADRVNDAFNAMLGTTNDPFRNEKIPFSPYAKARKGRRFLESYISRQIPARRHSNGKDLFTQLCNLKDEEGNGLSDDEIRDQIIFLLFAAHDTTTSALCGILHSLAANPAWQQELRQEMLDLEKEIMEFDDYDRMPKTHMTIQEGLRLYPPITLLPRYALEDFSIHGVNIKKGTFLFLLPTFTHRMPEYWSNPKQFDPYRFSPERAEDKKDFFQYVPFGGGAHKCLGLHFAQVQAKMFLFHLLKTHQVISAKGSKKYNHNNIPMALPRDGLPLTFKRI